MKVQELISLLGRFQKKDLLKIRSAINHLIGEVETSVSDDTEMLFNAIVHLLNMRLSYASFLKTKSLRSQWKNKARGVVDFIHTTFAPKDKATEYAVTLLLVQLLMEDMKKRNVLISLRTLVLNLGRVPVVFDDQYPGYREAGLVGVILKQMGARV
jgi:uncharacterized membrane protein YecN with MAPEG domain